MVGPIPGDVIYGEVLKALLARGLTFHLFIQNSNACNQDKFEDQLVKFGYVVYSKAESAMHVLRKGSVAVRRVSGCYSQVKVKKMDGLPFSWSRGILYEEHIG